MSDDSTDSVNATFQLMERHLQVDQFFDLLTYDGNLDDEFVSKLLPLSRMDDEVLNAILRRIVDLTIPLQDRSDMLTSLLKMHVLSGGVSYSFTIIFAALCNDPLANSKWDKAMNAMITATSHVNDESIPSHHGTLGASMSMNYKAFTTGMREHTETEYLQGAQPDPKVLVPKDDLMRAVQDMVGGMYETDE